MAEALNTRLIAHADCDGAGQVWLDGTTLFVAHQRPPSATTIFDVSDPRNPRLLSEIKVPMGWHSHKVRAKDGLMVVNHEKFREGDPGFRRRARHL